MISPVALLKLNDDATITTPAGDISPDRLAVTELAEYDVDTIQARVDTGTIYIPKADIEQCIDLRDLEFRPIDLADLE
ncbi:hypothetical protein [Halorientalis salina]|uniref:hypothetical protein n=1 Tax=Halorientalis salina TaxID=2932266 RepID=UPI0010AD0D45|nr:hypothetical protein [Halorientalis salina]